MKTLRQRIEDMPADIQQEIEDFAMFLTKKRGNRTKHILRQDWAGGLKEFNTQFTSLELQKKALEQKEIAL